jgi:Protein of unknown function (DUF4230)
MAKFVAFLSTACLIFVLVAIIVYLRLFNSGAHRTLNSSAVIKEVQQLNELAAVKYSIEKVVGMKEQKSPVGTESILLLVRGKVLAGVDLAGLTPGDVTVANRDTLRIRLTPPHIQETYLDEKYTKLWDRSITWWTPWVTPDADLEHKARMQALEDIKAAALDMGILAEARRNAEMDIREILRAFGIDKIVFAYGS